MSQQKELKPIPSDSAGREEYANNMVRCITIYESSIRAFLDTLDHAENQYQRLGMTYHRTSMASRGSARLDRTMMQNLESVFTDFNTWLEPRHEVREITFKALRECSTGGTPEALLERFLLCDKLFAEARRLYKIRGPAELFLDDDKLRRETQLVYAEHARRVRAGDDTDWCQQAAGTGAVQDIPRPLHQAAEWQMFRQWVYTFPETRRCVHDLGMSLDDIACRWLYQSMEDKGKTEKVPRIPDTDF